MPRFDKAVRGFPVERAGIRPNGSPHSAWELLEHMRISQNDILLFSQICRSRFSGLAGRILARPSRARQIARIGRIGACFP